MRTTSPVGLEVRVEGCLMNPEPTTIEEGCGAGRQRLDGGDGLPDGEVRRRDRAADRVGQQGRRTPKSGKAQWRRHGWMVDSSVAGSQRPWAMGEAGGCSTIDR